MKHKVTHGDKVRVSSHEMLETDLVPLVRALITAKAEVLIDEAARIDAENPSPATPKQRYGEAFGGVFRATRYSEGERYRREFGPTLTTLDAGAYRWGSRRKFLTNSTLWFDPRLNSLKGARSNTRCDYRPDHGEPTPFRQAAARRTRRAALGQTRRLPDH